MNLKNKIRKVLGVIIAVVMVVISISTVCNAAETNYFTGDIVKLGYYPQTEVTDAELIEYLNNEEKKWTSYKYYIGTGSYGSAKQYDFMKYCDVVLGHEKYRGVKFTSYRPLTTEATADNNSQESNGYELNEIYWFKFEPIEWRILDPESGLAISNIIIDSQSFNNINYFKSTSYGAIFSNTSYERNYYYCDNVSEIYANMYQFSTMKTWIEESFCPIFTSSEQSLILKADEKDSIVFLLEKEEAQNTAYFPSEATIKAKTSDYAKCQGLFVENSQDVDDYYDWWLSSDYGEGMGSSVLHGYSYRTGYYAYTVKADGTIGYRKNIGVSSTNIGVRPAIYIDLENIGEIQSEYNPKVHKVEITDAVSLSYRDIAKIDIMVDADRKAEYDVEFESSDGSIVTVNENGEIFATGRGSAIVTCTITDMNGNISKDVCEVTVDYTVWQWIITILLFGWLWY